MPVSPRVRRLSATWMLCLAAVLPAGAALGAPSDTAAPADPPCRSSGGPPARGAPLWVGAIAGRTGPDDFSSAAAAARAYFQCVNERGGIHGRPVHYLVEDDKWNPEVAAQAGARLVKDRGVLALVGNGSVVEMRVNARLYEQEGVVVIASACAVQECFESRNIVSTNGGPLPSNLGAVQWAVRTLGTRSVACISINTPGGGSWTCDAVNRWLAGQGLKGTSVLFDAGSADFTSVLLQAMATGADTLLVNLPAGLAVPLLKAAEEQQLRDQRRWIAPTPLYDLKIPAALGSYWAGKLHVHAELTRLDGDGPDARRWRAVTDRWGRSDAVATHRRDTFSQAGFVSADIFTHTLLQMDPRTLDRAAVTRALRAVRDWRTDLLCRPWYFGEGDRHLPNHAGLMLQYTGSGFRTVQACFDAESDYLAPIHALERQQGIGRR